MVGVSSEPNLGLYLDKATYDADGSGKADHIDGIGKIPAQCFDKAASGNLRNSHDAWITKTDHAEHVKAKTITFTKGIKGTLRIAFDLGTNNTNFYAYGRVYKNGVALGTAQSTQSAYATPETISEDLDVGEIAAGGTLELWLKATEGYESRARNFRAYYDNDTDAVVSAGVTS